ncbi:MAG: hypothetical protein WC878_08260 [Candidatus Paceibacterota bacterium]|jgi:hypothetical protein
MTIGKYEVKKVCPYKWQEPIEEARANRIRIFREQVEAEVSLIKNTIDAEILKQYPHSDTVNLVLENVTSFALERIKRDYEYACWEFIVVKTTETPEQVLIRNITLR